MPRACTFCGNKTGNFRFPKDEEWKVKWRAAIPRSNIPDHKDTVICNKHWPNDSERVLVNGKLRPRDDDPPSIFDVPKSMLPTPVPPQRGTKRSSAEARNTQPDQLPEFEKQDRIGDFQDLKSQIGTRVKEFAIPAFVYSHFPSEILLQSIDFADGTGIPRFMVRINSDQTFQSFHYGVRCSIPSLVRNRITKIKHWTQLEEICRFLKVTEPSHKSEVIQDQLRAMGMTFVGEKKYSIETTVRAFEYFALSRSTYNRLREDFELPSISTLTNLTSKVKSQDDESFIVNAFKNLPEDQKKWFIVLDEVYVKALLQYHGGILFGKAVNKPDQMANTVLSFMVVCLNGGPKFLTKMLPVKELDADFLFEQTNFLIDSLKKAGADITAVISDGNRVNQKFFKMFDTVEPWRTRDNMFLLFDFVHLLKNIRNNWITEATQELNFTRGGKKETARWADLISLQKLESANLTKLSKLTEVSVTPKPIERQRVSTVLEVFNEKTIAALKAHSGVDEDDVQGTIAFLEMILDFWKIVNVKGPYEDVNLRDPLRAPIRSPSDKNLDLLEEIAVVIENMTKTTKGNEI